VRYVVIDFEATCDEPFNPDPQEIIEFPAILVDEAGIVVEEFHTFVRPIAHPSLTAFCIELTGIRSEQLDHAPTFPDVVSQFQEWLNQHTLESSMIVTCGDWDLGSLLPRQCAQHRLPIPKWAENWCNLKELFAQHFPEMGQHVGMVRMINALGLSIVGRLHSGIDDARNIARILRKLIESGAYIENTALWHCHECDTENRYLARQCARCKSPRVEMQPGDWLCSRCGCVNFARRVRCYDCGSAG